MPRGRPKKIKEVSPVSPVLYKLTLKSLGRIYQSEGENLEEALNKLKIVGGAKAVSVLKVEHGDVVKERLINASFVQRCFGQGSPTTRAIFIKKIMTLYGL